MTEKRKKNNSSLRFVDCLSLSAFLISQDMLLTRENSLSVIRLYDQLPVLQPAEPPFLPQLNIVIEFWRKPNISNEQFDERELKYKVVLRTPQNKEVDISVLEASKAAEWLYLRSLMDVSHRVGFKGYGVYWFVLYGKDKDSDYSLVAERPFPVVAYTEPEDLQEKAD